MSKINREKFKIYKNVFDEFTLRALFKLSSQGFFDELKSPISIGKEANIFSAETRDKGLVILKMYRLGACDFNKMYDYIKYDPRYLNLKSKKREIIFSWAQREYRNLMKAREAGVKVPLALCCLRNILVIEFIGDTFKNLSAPKIKDVQPKKEKDIINFFDLTVKYMKRLYDSNMVHGDLSEFNILNFDNKPVFIDFSQSTLLNSPNAQELLERDVKNVCRFFSKFNIPCTQESLLNHIRQQDEQN